MDTQLFEEHEAEVRSYCRTFPTLFASSVGATLQDADGQTYIDFLAGAGTLNYGHNHPAIKQAVMKYIESNGVIHALDMYTVAKREFIDALYSVILAPRGLDYKITFPGPTGTNTVETALKFARRANGRQNVIGFTNAFHGMTQEALAASASRSKREAAGIALSGVSRMPYEGYLGAGLDTAEFLDRMLSDRGSGIDAPAAIIVETVQAEGGLNVASPDWLREIAGIARKHGAVLIIDDIQTGCGRTGMFFSFEGMGFTPDIVCLSKAVGGMGLPLSVVLLRPKLDVLKPGEHSGTFRGHNLAVVVAQAAIDLWCDPQFERTIAHTGALMRERLDHIVARFPTYGAQVRGRGMMLGIVWTDIGIAGRVSKAAFERRVIAETAGANDQVLKLLPPLTISEQELTIGLDDIERAIEDVVTRGRLRLNL